jgi:hypothetical protein
MTYPAFDTSHIAEAIDGRSGPITCSACGCRLQRAANGEELWFHFADGAGDDWDDARIHVGAHGLHYGTGVFEGIRCYDTPKGPAVFRHTDHMQRPRFTHRVRSILREMRGQDPVTNPQWTGTRWLPPRSTTVRPTSTR